MNMLQKSVIPFWKRQSKPSKKQRLISFYSQGRHRGRGCRPISLGPYNRGLKRHIFHWKAELQTHSEFPNCTVTLGIPYILKFEMVWYNELEYGCTDIHITAYSWCFLMLRPFINNKLYWVVGLGYFLPWLAGTNCIFTLLEARNEQRRRGMLCCHTLFGRTLQHSLAVRRTWKNRVRLFTNIFNQLAMY